jgi:hypothetical protein
VNFTQIVERLDVSPVATRTVSLAQVSDPSPQTFNESLLAASKASSSTSAANQAGTGTGNRQKPASQVENLPRSMSPARAVQSQPPPQKTVQQQVVVAHQLSLIDPAFLPMQRPLGRPGRSAGNSTVAAGLPTRDVPAVTSLPMEPKHVQPVVVKSDSIPSSQTEKENDSPQAASILADVPPLLQTAENPSKALGHGVLSTVSNTLLNPTNTDSTVSAGAVPGLLSDATQEAVPGAAPSAVPIVPAVPPSALLNAAPIAHSSAVQKPVSDAIPSNVPTATRGALPSALQNVASPMPLNAIPEASFKAAPAPVLHDAVNPPARGTVAPKSNSVPTSQAEPSAVTPDPGGLATGLSVPGATSDQLVALIQPGAGLFVNAQISASSISPATIAEPPGAAVANGKDGANNASNDAAGLNQHAQATSEPTASQTGSQGTGPSGDQSQGDAAQQGQSAAPAQVNFVNHTVAVVDHVQSAAVAAPLQTAPTPAGVAGHTAKTADLPAPATIVLPPSVPVINTAKLIQSMGQSQMQVGMRSNDFGNISISTSATRDLISAQISLDHAELAVHLPEMQARLGGDQAMNVRIDMNGQGATGQGAGTSSGMSNGSPDGSSPDRQQKGSTASNQSADGFAVHGSSIAAAGLPSGEGRLDAHIDIRV